MAYRFPQGNSIKKVPLFQGDFLTKQQSFSDKLDDQVTDFIFPADTPWAFF